jgi:hypothetical protein
LFARYPGDENRSIVCHDCNLIASRQKQTSMISLSTCIHEMPMIQRSVC